MKNICGIGAWKSVKGFLLHENNAYLLACPMTVDPTFVATVFPDN